MNEADRKNRWGSPCLSDGYDGDSQGILKTKNNLMYIFSRHKQVFCCLWSHSLSCVSRAGASDDAVSELLSSLFPSGNWDAERRCEGVKVLLCRNRDISLKAVWLPVVALTCLTAAAALSLRVKSLIISEEKPQLFVLSVFLRKLPHMKPADL